VLVAGSVLLAACGGTASVSVSASPSLASASPTSTVAPTATAVPTATTAASASAAAVPSDSAAPSSAPASVPPSVAPKPSVAPPVASTKPSTPLANPSAAPPANTGGAPPANTGGSALAPAITITNADEGKTFHVKVNQVVDVSLTADSGMQNWNVQDPDPAVLKPIVNPAAAAAQGVTLRAFQAAAAGTAAIMATDRPACPPGQFCPQFIRAFKATVIVDAA